MTNLLKDSPTQGRLVVVADPDRLADGFDAQHIPWEVVTADSFLAGIARAAEPGVRAIVARIEQGPRRLDAAIAGLRAAAGRDVRIVLCCRPHAEPLARRLLKSGADSYVIYPPLPEDLEAALGLSAEPLAAPVPTPPRAVEAFRTEELFELGEVFAHLDAGLGEVLARLAALICKSLRAEGVEITAYGQSARAGAAVASPCFTERLADENGQIGQVVLGPRREGNYGPPQIDAFRQLVRLASGILLAHHRESQTHEQARTDAVTGLRNRRYLNEFLSQVVGRAARERFRVTLLLFDVDNFKHYNDTYGHVAGDEILREVGQLMQRCCRSHDAVVRFGGDEFGVVFWDADEPRVAGSQHPTDPLTVVDRFRDALLSHRFASLGPHDGGRLTISGGLATYPWHASSTEELIAQADAALIAAKRQGKNRVLPFGGGRLADGSDLPHDSDPQTPPAPEVPAPAERPQMQTLTHVPRAPAPAPPAPAGKPETQPVDDVPTVPATAQPGPVEPSEMPADRHAPAAPAATAPKPAGEPQTQSPTDPREPSPSVQQRPTTRGILGWVGIVAVIVGWAFALACMIYLASMLKTYLSGGDLFGVKPSKVEAQARPTPAVIAPERDPAAPVRRTRGSPPNVDARTLKSLVVDGLNAPGAGHSGRETRSATPVDTTAEEA